MKRLILFELRKIWNKKLSVISVTAVLFLSALLTFSTYQNMYAFDGRGNEGSGGEAVQIDRSIADKYRGVLTDDKVMQMMADFKITADLHGMNAKYLYHNAMQSAVFARFSDMEGNWNGSSVSDIFGEEEIRVGYINGWLHTSRNFAKIILVLSLVIISMIAPVFSGEYGGVDQIILTSRYGRTKCCAAKVAAGFISSLALTVFVTVFQLSFAVFLYGTEGLDCSILFAPLTFTEGFVPFNIICGTLLAYQTLLALTSAVSVTGVTLLLSALCRNQMISLISSAALQFLPLLLPVSETSALFRLFVLAPIYQSQCFSILSVQQISGNILYAVWAVPVAVALMVSGMIFPPKIFAGHQI